VLTVRGRLLANAVTARLVGDDPATTDAVAAAGGAAGTIAPHA
jgi:hypothetical protein